MASAGIRKTPSGRYKVWWRLDDGSQGSQTFDDDDQATRYLNKLRAQWDDGTWINPQRGRISFNEWADEWWQTWSTHPRRSPNGLETTESNLRLHLRRRSGRSRSTSSVTSWCSAGRISLRASSATTASWRAGHC